MAQDTAFSTTRVDCMGCGLETCIEQRKKCLISITVDEVVQAVLESPQELPAM